MDKLMSKQLLVKEGIPTSKFQAVLPGDEVSYDNLVAQVGLPFMVKPISLGSSVGVSKVSNEDDFQAALKETLSYDQGFLVEEFIAGRELECAILGNLKAKASAPGEIIISPKYEFYTYDAKYQDPEAVEIKVPADIDPQVADSIKSLSLRAYKALRCEDFARVDLFLGSDNRIMINEINTIPGFTDSSMFPSLWGQHGISYQDLITQIIDLALEKFAHKDKLSRDYFED
jgi:D-alanine-D-alanine ligase